jgi:hypothetical protein
LNYHIKLDFGKGEGKSTLEFYRKGGKHKSKKKKQEKRAVPPTPPPAESEAEADAVTDPSVKVIRKNEHPNGDWRERFEAEKERRRQAEDEEYRKDGENRRREEDTRRWRNQAGNPSE